MRGAKMHGIGPEGSQAEADKWTAQLARSPHDRIARHNLGAELLRLDRPSDALAELDRAWHAGLRAGETATMRGHALLRLGQFEAAEAAYLDAIALKPELIEAPKALAALRPQLGRADAALEGYRMALAASPQTGMLWMEAMAAAKGHHDWKQLLEWTAMAERRFGHDTAITVFAANALSGLDRDAEALDLLRRAVVGEPDFAPAHSTLAHVLIRQGDYRSAEGAALQAARLAPQDQSGWALLGTIWRLLDDAREDWLCRYEAFVMELDIELPDGLADNLATRHSMQAHPADQSLRGGTQTLGNLFETADPVIQSLAQDLRRRIEEHILMLPVEANHPFLSRNTGRTAFSASWSVRLADSGFHISHIHPAGWLSSAMYISLPSIVESGDDAQGHLTFGVPDAALGVDMPARRVVAPRTGRLVLFPSYLWHGTTPFHASEPRLTIAFDTVPIAHGV